MTPQPAPIRMPALWQAPPREIAVFRALQLGDMLCVVPALRALRAAAPHARITLIGMPWASSFTRRFSAYIDELMVFPGYPGFPEQPANVGAMPHFLAEAQRRRFGLAIQLHGSGLLSNPLMLLFGAEHNAGHFSSGQFCPDPSRFRAWEDKEHEVLRFVRLMAFLGMPAQGEHLEFPLNEEDFRSLRRSAADLPAPGTYVCVHPGARLPSRRWFPERFAEVADRLAASGLRILLTGSADEVPVVNAVRRAMRMPALDLSGKTDLGALAALISRAKLVVSNDTGISHVAAAVATPSVIVSCGSDAGRWSPLDRERHHVVSAAVSCRPCMHLECPIGHPCAGEVSAETVAQAAGRILDHYSNGAHP